MAGRRLNLDGGNAETTAFVTAGRTLSNRYHLVREVGHGAMGVVYEARDERLDGKTVAVKVLPPDRLGDDEAVARLKHEAKTAFDLNHPNIVGLKGFEVDGPVVYLVMEFLDGRSVAEVLAGAETFKLCDFGIAATLQNAAAEPAAGTLYYCPPEQLRGEGVDARSEVYALGATVYELLEGSPPFREPGLQQKIRDTQPPPLGDSTALTTAVMLALAKDPDARPSAAAEFLAVAGSATIAPAPSPPQVADGPSVGRMALLLLLPVAAYIVVTHGAGWLGLASSRVVPVLGLFAGVAILGLAARWAGVDLD